MQGIGPIGHRVNADTHICLVTYATETIDIPPRRLLSAAGTRPAQLEGNTMDYVKIVHVGELELVGEIRTSVIIRTLDGSSESRDEAHAKAKELLGERAEFQMAWRDEMDPRFAFSIDH